MNYIKTITNGGIMDVTTLVKKFNDYQYGGEELTLEELNFLCDNEEHEAFMFSFSLYRDILDLRDEKLY